MAEPVLKSSLSEKEIADRFQDTDFFSEVKSGLDEALAFEKGSAKEATLVRKRNLPDVKPSELRQSVKMTQKDFAGVLGVSPRTVEAWESGRSVPSPTAKNLLFLIQLNPGLIQLLRPDKP